MPFSVARVLFFLAYGRAITQARLLWFDLLRLSFWFIMDFSVVQNHPSETVAMLRAQAYNQVYSKVYSLSKTSRLPIERLRFSLGRVSFFFALFLSFFSFSFASISAETDPDAAVKFRKFLMREIEASLVSSFLLVKGEVSDEASLSLQAQILSLAAERSGASFSFRTRGLQEETSAHERVWTKQADFQSLMREFATSAKSYADLVKRSEQDASLRASLGSALGGLGKQCKACHKRYRIDK